MKQATTAEQTQANIALVHSLVEAGKSRRTIIAETKLPERFVVEHMKGAAKGKKAAPVAKIARPNKLNTAAQQAYTLANRAQGCKDFELRNIAHSVYGATYTKDTLYSIKQRCAELAEDTDNVLKFVPDWICDEAPTASRVALETLSLELEALIQDKVNSFMEQHATGLDDDQIESTEAQRKQAYAARRHILKLAIKEYSPEPTATLLARSVSICEALEGTQDVQVNAPHSTEIKEAPVAPQESVDELEAFFSTITIVAQPAPTQEQAPAQTAEVESDDIFASVGVADSKVVKATFERIQRERDEHMSYLIEVMSDDVESTSDSIVFATPLMYDAVKPNKGFDITKYTGGKKTYAAPTGIEWKI